MWFVVLATPIAQHACIVKKSRNVLDPRERNFTPPPPLQQRSSCGPAVNIGFIIQHESFPNEIA